MAGFTVYYRIIYENDNTITYDVYIERKLMISGKSDSHLRKALEGARSEKLFNVSA